MERVELLQLMGFSEAEATAKATEEETIKAKFAATRKPGRPSASARPPPRPALRPPRRLTPTARPGELPYGES